MPIYFIGKKLYLMVYLGLRCATTTTSYKQSPILFYFSCKDMAYLVYNGTSLQHTFTPNFIFPKRIGTIVFFFEVHVKGCLTLKK